VYFGRNIVTVNPESGDVAKTDGNAHGSCSRRTHHLTVVVVVVVVARNTLA